MADFIEFYYMYLYSGRMEVHLNKVNVDEKTPKYYKMVLIKKNIIYILYRVFTFNVWDLKSSVVLNPMSDFKTPSVLNSLFQMG